MTTRMDDVERDLAWVLCVEIHATRYADLGKACGQCRNLAAEQVRMLRETWGLVEETRRQTQTGFGGILIASNLRALPQGTYSRLKLSPDWHPTKETADE